MDFLKTFACEAESGGRNAPSVKQEPLGEENVELSLGLSLNGQFGVERRKVVTHSIYNNYDSLIRASSVADVSTFPLATEDPTSSVVSPPLTRTCSLPIETEEEWKKRKEMQSLRRSEAKRKRVEKLKNVKVVRGFSTEDDYETKTRNLINGNDLGRSSPPPPFPLLPRQSPFPSQATTGSPASGGSSGVSDLESRPFSGMYKDPELKSTASQHSEPNQMSDSRIYRSNSDASETPTVNRNDDTLKMMLADMPCVSTKGDGVNGKKIDGFLYRYRKGQEVRIVCVCHGSFLTPAEFVKHGGRGDIEHPLRHIVVNPPSL